MQILFIPTLLLSSSYATCTTKEDCNEGTCINNICKCKYGFHLYNGYCDKSCKHGNFSRVQDKCICDEGWKRASFSNTLEWFKDVCTQYKCKSDQECRRLLPNVDNPTCPVKGWDCYCYNKLWYENNDAKCMGFMYWLSVSAVKIYLYLSIKVYPYIFATLIIISIPFGTRRYRCDHYRSWWCNFKRKLGIQIICHGECTRKKRFYFRDDFALSIYNFKLFIWWYTFTTCLVIIFAFVWSIALWMLVLLLLVIIGIVLCLGLCASTGEGGLICFDCQTTDCICSCDNSSNDDNNSVMTINEQYLSTNGPLPESEYSICCIACLKKYSICKPIVYLINSYPNFPDNLQGGIVGYLSGTHILNSKNINKIPGYILSLKWIKKNRDLRHDKSWQQSVSAFMNDQYNSISTVPTLKNIKRTSITSDLINKESVIISTYKHITVHTHENPITLNGVCATNRECIQDDECWICCNFPVKWHKWDCNHVYCQTCSYTMINKDIPCPLCRKVTLQVHSYPLEHSSLLS